MTELPRRQLLAQVGAAGIATGAATDVSDRVVSQSSDDNDGGNWPQFGASARNMGHNPDVVAPSSHGGQWVFETGGPVSSPVVADQTVFIGSH